MKKRMFASRYVLWILASGFLRCLYYTSLTVKDFVGTEKGGKGPLLAGAGKVCEKALWSKGLFNRKGWHEIYNQRTGRRQAHPDLHSGCQQTEETITCKILTIKPIFLSREAKFGGNNVEIENQMIGY